MSGMSDAVREVGWGKALAFALGQIQAGLLRCGLVLPPVRWFFLRVFRAAVGPQSVIHSCTFFNIYRTGFRGFETGHHCFIGEECLFDLADCIVLGDHVTIAERVTVLTHVNVGFKDHPLQKEFPPMLAPVMIKSGCFIGANATIMPGVIIGECAVVGAGSLVREDVAPRTVVAGVPAKPVRTLDVPSAP